ncbi:MAG: hypothetical protein GZ087_02770 [Flavobacterium sp.]|nr:hypothetical protein [Flavobacterium sp.]
MNINKKVILLYNSIDYFVPFFEQKGVLSYPSYRNLSFVLRIVRKIFFLLGLPKSIWYGNWTKSLDEVSTVICFSTNPIESLEYIKTVHPHIRLIFWYWDPAYRNVHKPNTISESLCEKWSFDVNDCQKYKMKYNTTFYLDSIPLPKTELSYDVFFLGQDKGRKVFLNDLKNQIIGMHLVPFFYIVGDNTSGWNFFKATPAIPYVKYLELLSKSKAILDYTQDGQSGLSLRPMESIFFEKKLITNDLSIMTNDFYLADNIFVLGVDLMGGLTNFLNTPYKKIPQEIVAKYDFTNWLARFFV